MSRSERDEPLATREDVREVKIWIFQGALVGMVLVAVLVGILIWLADG